MMVPFVERLEPRRAVQDSEFTEACRELESAVVCCSDGGIVRNSGGGVGEQFYHVDRRARAREGRELSRGWVWNTRHARNDRLLSRE